MSQIDMFSTQTISPLCSIFFFIMISVGSSKTFPFPFTNETDRQALFSIKDMISGDPLGILNSWNHSIHFCNWHGVSCGRRHQRVTVLNLPSLGLVGPLSPYIGNLTFLRMIDLSNNSFHGEIPLEIGKLFRLQYLQLFINSFEGEFPANLTYCSDLRVISLVDNNLGGKIPAELGSLSNLIKFSVAKNHFTGPIPLSLGNLSNLVGLSLSHNNLEGSIPFELARFSKLQILILGFNNFSGMVPTSLYNISSITYFSVNDNQLHGSFPSNLGLTLPKLQAFHIGSNQFYGPIPSSIANASGLVEIETSQNSLTGPLPMNFGTLYELQKLNSHTNRLGTGDRKGNELMDFLTSLSNCSNLQWLDMAINGFKSLLPDSIANLSTTITRLTLDGNYIFGSIPLGIGNLVNLRTLYLSTNMLVGSIPNSIGKLSNLEQLLLLRNNISGEIPSLIGNITRLGILDLSINMIEGSIPVSLGDCTNLREFYLEDNHLTGDIPQEIFGLSSLTILILSQNYLRGFLPQEVGNLKNLERLNISENKLFGEIPATLSNCQVLEFLYMMGNLFEGTIPESFKQLKGLQVLDVSRNNLSRQIPSFLSELPLLLNLNLSYNMFDGEIPNGGVFRNISAFSIVGNKKLCGGIKVLQLPACPAKDLKERRRPFKRRVIVVVVTLTIFLLIVCTSAIIYRTRRSRQQASSTLPLQNQLLQLSYGEIFHATNGFSSTNLIGEGRYGLVYKGILKFGELIVAVKVLKLHECGAIKSFKTECEALKNIRHHNLVKVITSCSSIDFKGNDFKALVFEFMKNGSLENWLHPISFSEQQDPNHFTFVQRLNIAIDVASALDYLHHHCEVAIVHCDLKPSNILLDDNLCAHVGDFGLTRILSATTGISSHHQSSSIGIRGTVGYVAPEYGMGEEVSTQGDMYSFGVLLLEMFTGKRPTDNMFIDNINLHIYAKKSLSDQVMQIVDRRIILAEEEEPSRAQQSSTNNISKLEVCLALVIQIGVSCSVELPHERMNARDVLMELQKIRNIFLGFREQN
ncbi:unnamed protein product [Camellia sinensis]